MYESRLSEMVIQFLLKDFEIFWGLKIDLENCYHKIFYVHIEEDRVF
jgi:hypothetical protein